MRRERRSAWIGHWKGYSERSTVIAIDRCAHPVWQHCAIPLLSDIFASDLFLMFETK